MKNNNVLEYQLLDTGNFRKLEQVGEWKLIRPALNACWQPKLAAKQWQSADAEFLRDSSGHGKWKIMNRPLPESWQMRWGNFNLHIKPTSFGHLGFFAEQYANWEFFEKIIPSLGKNGNGSGRSAGIAPGCFPRHGGVGQDQSEYE